LLVNDNASNLKKNQGVSAGIQHPTILIGEEMLGAPNLHFLLEKKPNFIVIFNMTKTINNLIDHSRHIDRSQYHGSHIIILIDY
jgi:hypothetical protein